MCRNGDDTVDFVKELPYRLRMELAYRIHLKVHQSIQFFKNKPKDFLFQLSNVLRPIRAKKGQYLYKEGEPVVESKLLRPSHICSLLHEQRRGGLRPTSMRKLAVYYN